eukprot:6944464-Alexandrium_andersonii.AAC.1
MCIRDRPPRGCALIDHGLYQDSEGELHDVSPRDISPAGPDAESDTPAASPAPAGPEPARSSDAPSSAAMPVALGGSARASRGLAARRDTLQEARECWQTRHLRSLGLRDNGSSRAELALDAVRLAALEANVDPDSLAPPLRC